MPQADSLQTPLTQLSQDETLFRDSVYEFADREIRPLVREMDEHAKIHPPLIGRLFELGVMGIEIPERFAGGGATFFHSVLAVEALSRVDPSIGVLVDVQNTLVINALMRWASEEITKRQPRSRARRARSSSRSSRLSEPLISRSVPVRAASV